MNRNKDDRKKSSRIVSMVPSSNANSDRFGRNFIGTDESGRVWNIYRHSRSNYKAVCKKDKKVEAEAQRLQNFLLQNGGPAVMRDLVRKGFDLEVIWESKISQMYFEDDMSPAFIVEGDMVRINKKGKIVSSSKTELLECDHGHAYNDRAFLFAKVSFRGDQIFIHNVKSQVRDREYDRFGKERIRSASTRLWKKEYEKEMEAEEEIRRLEEQAMDRDYDLLCGGVFPTIYRPINNNNNISIVDDDDDYYFNRYLESHYDRC